MKRGEGERKSGSIRQESERTGESINICDLTKRVCLSEVFLFIPQASRQTESKSLLEYIRKRAFYSAHCRPDSTSQLNLLRKHKNRWKVSIFTNSVFHVSNRAVIPKRGYLDLGGTSAFGRLHMELINLLKKYIFKTYPNTWNKGNKQPNKITKRCDTDLY